MSRLRDETTSGLKIAVVGSGVSGIVCASLLDKRHRVTLFEKRRRLGGHTNTVVVPKGPDEGLQVDTGFIVLNDTTYPNFHRFLDRLGVTVRESCMSFGYYCENTGLAYAGTDLNGLFARRSNLLRPRFWNLLYQIWRFSKIAPNDLRKGRLKGQTLGDFLLERDFSRYFQIHYLVPLSAAIWSSSDGDILDFPAEMFLRFLDHHGLLTLRNRPQWQTVVGGSHAYLKAFQNHFSGVVELGTGIDRVKRAEGQSVTLTDSRGEQHEFDRVILATHADQALKMLENPTNEERALQTWRYSRNRTVLHTDSAVLPPNKRAWASWNYRRRGRQDSKRPVTVTYDMNRLQGLQSSQQYCVTLNPDTPLMSQQIIYETDYQHPIFDSRTEAAQAIISRISGQNSTYFCGAHLGNGFHEDGVNSALAVTRKFGVNL